MSGGVAWISVDEAARRLGATRVFVIGAAQVRVLRHIYDADGRMLVRADDVERHLAGVIHDDC